MSHGDIGGPQGTELRQFPISERKQNDKPLRYQLKKSLSFQKPVGLCISKLLFNNFWGILGFISEN